MPKIVDHQVRRRELAQAVVEVASKRSLDHASLRAVAQQAGMSMGTVQHYFEDRKAMLDFVLEYTQQQRTERIERAVVALATPTPTSILGAVVDEILTVDETNLMFEQVNMMFINRAHRDPDTATRLGRGRAEVVQLFTGLFHDLTLRDGLTPEIASEILWALLEDLPIAITLGQHTSQSARAVAHSYLKHIIE
ncbi:TetR/AcrR family transcriptional regulator [Corynebacterium sp. H113]|uniref:TetR/AcrR family transcriptional regulator n=1 Tax=Corynebacterium sp. H113 TaxID=3133419 RepID=UPI0030A650E5